MLRAINTLLLAVVILVNMPSTSTAVSALQLLITYGGSSCGASTFATAIDASGVLTCSTPTASTPLSSIAAATGANTIASGNNTGQVWNWTNTTNSTVAFTFGETSAATNGTSTAGVPNQILMKFATLAGSTQSPFQIFVRGSHLISADFTNAQLLATGGSTTVPPYSFAANSDSGMALVGSRLQLNGNSGIELYNGGTRVIASNSANCSGATVCVTAGTATAPGLRDLTNYNTGLFWPTTNTFGIGNQTFGEMIRWTAHSASAYSSQWAAVSFTNFPTGVNGMLFYCSDCTIANPCAGSGNGAFAKRLNGVWVCN